MNNMIFIVTIQIKYNKFIYHIAYWVFIRNLSIIQEVVHLIKLSKNTLYKLVQKCLLSCLIVKNSHNY